MRAQNILWLMSAALIIGIGSTTALAHAQQATSTSNTLTGTVIDASSATATSTTATTTSSTTSSMLQGMLTGTVFSTSTGTSTTGTTTPPTSGDLNSFISALRGLEPTFPNFTSQLEWFIHYLLGMGTTTMPDGGTTTPPMMGVAHIDQQGMMKAAGDQIDFGGHNFMAEEDVMVMMSGMQVAHAHADGGGNFSTGSVRLPSIPGTYTYTFLGTGGDTATATIVVQ